MQNKSHEELVQLARDIVHGKVFTDRHLPEEDLHLLKQIFMILALLDGEQLAELAKDPPGMFYEYLREASSSIYGYPCFMSVQALSLDDAMKVNAMVKTLLAAEREALKSL